MPCNFKQIPFLNFNKNKIELYFIPTLHNWTHYNSNKKIHKKKYLAINILMKDTKDVKLASLNFSLSFNQINYQ